MALVRDEEAMNDPEQELYTETECDNIGGQVSGGTLSMMPCSSGSRVPSVMMMPVDPEPHMSSQFYTFNRASHRLMVRCLMAARHPTAEEIRSVATPAVLASWRGVWKDRHEDTAYLTGWRRIQEKLHAQVDDVGNEVLFLKNNPYQFVPFIEQWGGIVQQFHIGPDLKHLGHKETLDKMREVWTVGAKFYGVPESYVKVCISTCPVCGTSSNEEQALIACSSNRNSEGKSSTAGGGAALQQSRRKRFEYTESFEVVARDVPQRLQHLAAKYKVVLCIRQKYIRYKPFLAEVKDYCCHRGGEPTGRKPGVLKRKRYMSKRCGCSFRIRAIVPITNYDEKEKTFSYQEEGVATFKLYAVHSGHEPGPHEGSARIIHRFVDPSSISEELASAAEKEEEEEARQGVLGQIQELQMELGSLEHKLENASVDVLNTLCQDITNTMQRLRNIEKASAAAMKMQQHHSNNISSEDIGGLSEQWAQDELNKEEQDKSAEEEHVSQLQRCRSSKKSLDSTNCDARLSCPRCRAKDDNLQSGGFCKNCESLLRQSGACSEDGSMDSRDGTLAGMQVTGYCGEADKWYEGMACGLDTAHAVELGFGHLRSEMEA